MTKTLDDKLREILFKAAGGITDMAAEEITQVKQAIAEEIRACEPEKKSDNLDFAGSLIRIDAISEYTENLTKKGLR